MWPILFEVFGYEVSSWSVMVILGVLCFIYVYFYRLRKMGASEKTIDRLTIITSIAGIFIYLGASFFDDLWHSISIAIETGKPFVFDSKAGGITFQGGIVTGIIAFFILFPLGMNFDKNRGLNYMDQAAIGILIAHAFGRIGCFLGGCCFGGKTDFFLGIYYPSAGTVVHPTQLYEAVFLFICFFIFFFFIKKNITEKYLIVYGVFRFFLEFIRGDDRGASPFGFLTPSQLMSIVMIIGGVICFFIRKRVLRKELEKYEQAEEKPEPSIRHYQASYKGLIFGLTHKCECPNCKQKMKVKFHSDLEQVNEVELLNKEHLVYKCKECEIEQEIA